MVAVEASGLASWVLYRQRLVLELLQRDGQLLAFRCCQRLAVSNKEEELETLHCQY